MSRFGIHLLCPRFGRRAATMRGSVMNGEGLLSGTVAVAVDHGRRVINWCKASKFEQSPRSAGLTA